MSNQYDYDAIIIGAGISGLVCGCYLAKAGMKVLIVEKNAKPGGYCTSFTKGGFHFDACVHSLGSLREGGNLRIILKELGLEERLKIKRYDPSDIIIAPDSITEAYVKERAKRHYNFYTSDADSKYVEVREYNCSKIPPTVSCPHLPSNVRPAAELFEVTIDQVVIGSCTNGHLEDLREAAMVIKGRKVNPNVRMIIIPATQKIYREAMREGLIDIFIEAEAAVSTPTCGPCLGGHMGILAKGERAIATNNRNFIGRMGHPESEVYLSSPAVAASSAVLGRIGIPEELGL
ncbi:MAG: FAD-dependent oxidoreductase [Thermodesulfovibrionales bacterium]|nr:FAD-dependent oxidoreductase [Thermodesulfovibrionales bacterium]